MALVYIGLGSNIGDRVGYVQQAHSLLSDTEGIKIIASSTLYETEPVGFKRPGMVCKCCPSGGNRSRAKGFIKRMPKDRETVRTHKTS